MATVGELCGYALDRSIELERGSRVVVTTEGRCLELDGWTCSSAESSAPVKNCFINSARTVGDASLIDFPLMIVTLSVFAPGNRACGVLEEESMDDHVGRFSDSEGTVCRMLTAMKPGSGDGEASARTSVCVMRPLMSMGLVDRAIAWPEPRSRSCSLRR